ncbi:ATP-binding protein [Rhizobium sp. FY34]|uniref:ATP-binding protein n=1 Tax=Rhizobium sp. FY34 TaxID=2562309 RepID=UPI001484D38B|nr:ATP-binding protein [Rhizobium sp. FY34]
MGSSETHDLTPSPSEMLLSLRNVGYTLQTAVADIVDNSISANASRIDIDFNWSGKQSFISISDNGNGMSEDRLLEAMRLGRNPQDLRQLSDLGRFGLGLKMASWSQCRSFTVRSRLEDGSRATLRWDIDHMLATDRWEALSDPRVGSEQLLSSDNQYPTGTVVLWEALDVLDQTGTLSASHLFWEATERVEKHLAMTFHRFIERKIIKITVNGMEVKPWDPLMSGNPYRSSFPKDYIRKGGRCVIFEGHVLPRKSQLTEQEYKDAAGPDDWNASQGFYVYRGDRLVIGGGWLGLGKGSNQWKAETAFKTIRISLDITNAADLDWSLDLLKSTATPPAPFRARIVQLADHIRRTGKALSSSERKKRKATEGDDALWKRRDTGATSQFKINRDHEIVKEALAEAKNSPSVKRLLDLLDKTAPIQPITAAVAPPPVQLSPEDQKLVQLARTISYTLKRTGGVGDAEILRRLLAMPEFLSRPDLAETGIAQARATET